MGTIKRAKLLMNNSITEYKISTFSYLVKATSAYPSLERWDNFLIYLEMYNCVFNGGTNARMSLL